MAPVQHNYALQSHAPSYSATNAPNLRGPYSPYDNPHAARGYKYASAGAVLYDFDSELYGIQGRAGYQSAGLFGGELEASIGLSTDSSQLGTATVTRDIDYSIAAFGVARIPLNEKINFLGRAGLHSTRVADTFEDGATLLSSADTDAGLAFGIGVEYALSSRNSLRLDHTRYDLDAGGADSVSLAFATKF